MEVTGILDNEINVKKRILYIFLLAVIVSMFSLLHHEEGSFCGPNSGPNVGICAMIPESRGWPLPVVLEDPYNRINETLWVEQLVAFFVNFLVYFVVFGSVYFAYIKLIKRSKKK